MHLLRLSQKTDLGGLGVLEAGDYVCHDLNAFEIAQIAPRGSATIKSDFYHVWLHRKPKTILVMRSGAWGDLLLLTPAFREFVKANPDCSVTLCCFKHHFETMIGHEWALTEYPIPFDKFEEYDRIISLENVMELAHYKHATDAFADALGVKVTDYKPSFKVFNPKEKPARKRPVVGIQMMASVANRNYHLSKWNEVIDGLVKNGWEVWLFGKRGQLPALSKEWPHVVDMSVKSDSCQETASLLQICDAFVGVDSALIHLCHALDVPAVGLYGPFPWQIRTAKAPLTTSISGNGPCAPCYWHMHAGRQFPPNGPCAKTGYCTVLADIKPERIVAKVNALKPHA